MTTSLDVNVLPIIENDYVHSTAVKEEEALSKIDKGLRKLCGDSKAFSEIRGNLQKRDTMSTTVYEYLKRAGTFDEDKLLLKYARQYFSV